MYTSRALPLPSLTVTIFLLFLVFNTLATGQTTTQVTVTSDPLWTDTHLSLKAGQTIAINASGSWNWGQAQANFGPDGDPSTPFGYYGDEFEGFDLVDHGRLIGFVGPDPYQGNWRNSAFFPQTSGYLSIGSGETFTTPYGGELWLGFNDDAVAGGVNDNTGQVVANITEGNRDITGPSISIGAPSNYYLLNQKVAAKYSCSDPDDAVATCAGPLPPAPTSTPRLLELMPLRSWLQTVMEILPPGHWFTRLGMRGSRRRWSTSCRSTLGQAAQRRR